jgi:NADPH-dependent curcumin reductase CurA
MRIKIYGFIVIDYMYILGAVLTELARAWQDGKIVIDDSVQTVIEARFEDVPSVWLKLFEGANVGKLCTRIVS